MYKYYFNEFNPYSERYIVVTRSAVRVYENKQKALSTYGKPLIAIPLNAVKRVDRIKFDMSDEVRMENASEQTLTLNKHMLEFLLKDEFLPIYTHQQYSKKFKDTSVAVSMSPDRKSTLQQSPMRGSTISKVSTSQMG